MSDDHERPSSNGAVNDGGVLANLPRSRPQRASARRAATRNDSAARKGGDGAAPRPSARKASAVKRSAGVTASGAPRRASAKRAKAVAADDPAPRQGYECERETPTGAVQPPAGVELVATAAEIVGELAKAGVSTGERLLRDALSRLPL